MQCISGNKDKCAAGQFRGDNSLLFRDLGTDREPSNRQWDGRVPEYVYPAGSMVYRVKSRGTRYMGKKETVFLSETLTGEYIMLEE